jgi:hypothetical protein
MKILYMLTGEPSEDTHSWITEKKQEHSQHILFSGTGLAVEMFIEARKAICAGTACIIINGTRLLDSTVQALTAIAGKCEYSIRIHTVEK